MSGTTPVTPPGWYDDPSGPGALRWWDGSRWTEHAAPRPAGRPTAPKLSSSFGALAVCTQALLLVTVAVGLAAAAVDIWSIGVVDRALEAQRPITLATGRLLDLWHRVAAAAEVTATLATASAFVTWLYQAHHSDRMDRGVLKHSSGWAIGGWFVPVLNLWRPLEMVQDVWRGASAHDSDQPRGHTSALVISWWTILLAAAATSRVAGAVASSVRGRDNFTDALNGLRLTYWTLLVSNGLTVVAGVLAVLVVRRLTAAVRRAPAGTWYV